MDKLKYTGIPIVIIGLFLLLNPIWAHGPDPVGTIILKGTLSSADAKKGIINVLDKKGKKYAIHLVKGSQVMICDVYGCHLGSGNKALTGYKYELPSGAPVVVDFNPTTGEADRIDIHVSEHHYLNFDLDKNKDTEE